MASTFSGLIVGLVVSLTGISARAQENKSPLFADKGFMIGAGYGVNSNSLPEGKYIPVFFIAHFGMDLIKPSKLLYGQRLMLFFEPQVNSVVIRRPGENGNAAEAGLNAGFQYMYPLSSKFFLYTLVSTGPHYITVFTERQAHGFIFSDNMGAGTYFFLTRKIALNTGMRIRHMSNANTRMPNHGINTVNYFLGLNFMLP